MLTCSSSAYLPSFSSLVASSSRIANPCSNSSALTAGNSWKGLLPAEWRNLSPWNPSRNCSPIIFLSAQASSWQRLLSKIRTQTMSSKLWNRWQTSALLSWTPSQKSFCARFVQGAPPVAEISYLKDVSFFDFLSSSANPAALIMQGLSNNAIFTC